MKVLNQQAANRHRHPAVLVSMVVHRTDLANLPADRDQFVKGSLVDQIASVMLRVPANVGNQSLRRDRRVFKEFKNFACLIECRLRKLVQLGYEVLNGKLARRGVSGQSHLPLLFSIRLALPVSRWIGLCGIPLRNSVPSVVKSFFAVLTQIPSAQAPQRKAQRDGNRALVDQHAIAIRVEAIFLLDGMPIGGKHLFFPAKRADEHQ